MKRVAIVGVGLIGTSFALALRATGFAGEIIGVSSPRSIQAGVAAGAISRGVSLEEAAEYADLIYLSQPIEQILSTLVKLGPLAPTGCLITDAGSTKGVITQTAHQHVRYATFLGGHPMAGKEQRGAEMADADLFRQRPYILTPPEAITEAVDTTEFRLWLERIGAIVLDMDAESHDRTVAFTSHLPQLLSTALASTLAKQSDTDVSQVFGSGLVDMTRLALSSPDIWMSILSTNKEAISLAISEFTGVLKELQLHLRDGTLVDQFTYAANFARHIRKLNSTT